MPSYTYVDQPDRISARVSSDEIIGVDTEFMREKTFYAELCLLQVASGADFFCIDPLAGHDMAEFWRGLCERSWVVHSARQDIEVIYQTSGQLPIRLFDTQIAAALLGYQPQIGYAALVAELFDVNLPKAHTRADWSKRPLSDEILQYAAEDVEYLLPAYEKLAERLHDKGRFDWAIFDSSLMLDPGLHEIDPGTAVVRVKAARNFKGTRYRAAGRLAAWREIEAMRRNLPRQWIMKDNVLADIAYHMPDSIDALAKIDGIAAKTVQRIAPDLLAELAMARSANGAGDGDNRVRMPDDEQKSVLKMMQKLVAECASDLGVAAETIASRKELSAVVSGERRETRVFTGWRKGLVGDRLAEML